VMGYFIPPREKWIVLFLLRYIVYLLLPRVVFPYSSLFVIDDIRLDCFQKNGFFLVFRYIAFEEEQGQLALILIYRRNSNMNIQ